MGPICIEQMTFKKPLGPNDTLITMVSGKAGRERNPPLSESPVQPFDNMAPHGQFWIPFWRPLDFEGGPQSDSFLSKSETMQE